MSSRLATVTDADGNVLSYAYDACGDRASMSLTVDGTTVTDVDYTYTDGRLTGIEAAGSAGGSAGIFSYSYLANSNLVQTLTQALDVENPVPVVTTRTWDAADQLLSIASAVPSTLDTLASYAYTLDVQGRRTRRDDLDGTHIDWTYNNRDELTAAVRSGYATDKPYGDYPYQYGYTFDDIGNHLRQDKNGTTFAARYNSLNELLEREVTGPVRVQGTADGVLPIGVKVDGAVAETATVDADTAAWRGDSRPIQPGQTGTKSISVVATDSAQPPKKTESVRTVELPPANPVRFTYDANGNLASDGAWTYAWDQENRLSSVTSVPSVVRLTFSYDSQWRRRTKSVYAWDGQSQTWTLTRSHLFLYDGWNLIHEIVTDHTQTPAVDSATSYVWGLDLSQTLQGAGGVGGLLSITRPSTMVPLFPCYDGNGNVVALASAADGSVAAQYDYSPFGEAVLATGSAAEANLFRFSTKYTDLETGLVYYGYRYLAPGLGRWVCRDPMGEAGGENIHLLTRNRVPDGLDALGLKSVLGAAEAAVKATPLAQLGNEIAVLCTRPGCRPAGTSEAECVTAATNLALAYTNAYGKTTGTSGAVKCHNWSRDIYDALTPAAKGTAFRVTRVGSDMKQEGDVPFAFLSHSFVVVHMGDLFVEGPSVDGGGLHKRCALVLDPWDRQGDRGLSVEDAADFDYTFNAEWEAGDKWRGYKKDTAGDWSRSKAKPYPFTSGAAIK